MGQKSEEGPARFRGRVISPCCLESKNRVEKMKITGRKVILLGILAGVVLSVPLSLAIIRWKSENRGVVINHWRVSLKKLQSQITFTPIRDFKL
jgi:hypothetical protein